MGIQIAALKRIANGGPISAWTDCPPLGEGVELLLEFASTEATQALYGLDKSTTARDVPDDEFRDWNLDRVKDWRGIDDGSEPAPFDRAALVPAWDADARFRAWLVGRTQSLASFLRGSDTAPAVEMGAGRKRASARRAR